MSNMNNLSELKIDGILFYHIYNRHKNKQRPLPVLKKIISIQEAQHADVLSVYDFSHQLGLESSLVEGIELRDEFENTPWVRTYERYIGPVLQKESALELIYRYFEEKLESVPDQEFQQWEDRRTEFLYYLFCLGKRYQSLVLN